MVAPRSFFCQSENQPPKSCNQQREEEVEQEVLKKPLQIKEVSDQILCQSSFSLVAVVNSCGIKRAALSPLVFPIKPSLSFSVVRLPPFLFFFFFFLVLPSKTSGPRSWSCAVQLSISRDINVQPHPVVEAELHALAAPPSGRDAALQNLWAVSLG